MPNRVAVRVVGVVTGYGSVTRAVADLTTINGAPATIRIRVEQVVSGNIGKTEIEVALFETQSDCRSAGVDRDSLQRRYPVGTTIAVFGTVIAAFSARDQVAILAARNQGGFAEAVPRNPSRIPTGELDFRNAYGKVSQFILEFEFDRALLALADAPKGERFARLMNLADYPYSYHAFRDADRKFYAQLVSDSVMTEQETRQLMERFEDDEGRMRAR
jgi:hypothetical protein